MLLRNGCVVNKISCTKRSSFEASEWMDDVETARLRIIVGYRPSSYLPNHSVSTTVSLGEFSDYLESVVMPSELLFISGDFNIHVDVPTAADGIRFRDLLDSMRLLQHVKRPTYIHGHTLDILITRQSEDIITKEPETERYFSDHAVVLSHRKRAKPTSTVKYAEFRKLKGIDDQKFLEDICTSSLYRDPSDTLEELVECYKNTLRMP